VRRAGGALKEAEEETAPAGEEAGGRQSGEGPVIRRARAARGSKP